MYILHRQIDCKHKEQFEPVAFRVKLVFLWAENGECVLMYRPCFCVLLMSLFAGCAGFDGGFLSQQSSDTTDRAVNTLAKPGDESNARSYQQERQALFDQPYIDPLTDYLKQHAGDAKRALVIQQVEDERERRCDAIAGQYGNEPATEPVLERYRAGYAYSCPEQVSAFTERVKQEVTRDEVPEVITDTSPKGPDSPAIEQKALGDCYLLTSIRNYSAAREACREPAQQGDTRSQANMAMIAHAFEDYASALQWAERAAPASSEASYLIGRMYAAGNGVEQDMNMAVYWYTEAAGQGHREAKAALDRHREQQNPVGDT